MLTLAKAGCSVPVHSELCFSADCYDLLCTYEIGAKQAVVKNARLHHASQHLIQDAL